MKGLVQHTPTDDDISNLLKEFTVDFLLKGYSYLVEELHMQLLSNAVCRYWYRNYYEDYNFDFRKNKFTHTN